MAPQGTARGAADRGDRADRAGCLGRVRAGGQSGTSRRMARTGGRRGCLRVAPGARRDSHRLRRHAGTGARSRPRVAHDDAANLPELFQPRLSGSGLLSVKRGAARAISAGAEGVKAVNAEWS